MIVSGFAVLVGCGSAGGSDESFTGGTASSAEGSSGGSTQGPGPGTGDPTSQGTSPTADDSSGDASSSDDDSSSTGDPPQPGEYEGFGAVTKGHEDCPQAPAEVHVTTLEDSGPGSLRDALSDGCRLVVFDVGGTITLQSDLNLPYSYVTIDGLSAPDPGITIEQPGTIGTTIEARNSVGPVSDIIIHHLRMDGMALSHDNEGDIWGLDGEANPVSRIIIDHVTGIASTDGVFDIWEDVKDVTISWCLVLDTITALHLSTSEIANTRERISLHHNVFARNNERQIRLRHGSTEIDYVNNVIYGWGWFEGGAAGLHVAYDDGEVNPGINVVANVFHFVEGQAGSGDDGIKLESGPDVGNVFFDGNIVPAGESDNVSTGAGFVVPAEAAVTQYAAGTLSDNVVPHVGTQYPTDDESNLLIEIGGAL